MTHVGEPLSRFEKHSEEEDGNECAPIWPLGSQSKALEHALDPEKKRLQAQMQEARQGAPSTLGVILLIVGCGMLLLVPHLTIPLWIGHAIRQVFLGQWPTLSRTHWQQIGITMGCFVGLLVLGGLLKGRIGPRLYDQKLAAQKTLTMAYRVRIRLSVFGPAEPAIRPFWQTSWQEHQCARRVRAVRDPVLASLIAAYRQFDLARGSFFRARHLRPEQTARLFGRDQLTRLARTLLTRPVIAQVPMRMLF